MRVCGGGGSASEPFPLAALAEREAQAARQQMRQRWESLRLELKTKVQLMQKNLKQDHKQTVQSGHGGGKQKLFLKAGDLIVFFYFPRFIPVLRAQHRF